MRFIDSVTLTGTRRTADGYLVVDARAARTGIQIYRGTEVDPDNAHGLRDNATVNVYRPEDEVFGNSSLSSFTHRPLTVGHPAEMVTADNWKSVSVGHTGDEVARDGAFVRVPMMVADAAAIQSIEAGTSQLSAGYTCDLAFGQGQTPDGVQYDAIQKNIRVNHVAIVAAGRAGPEVRIGDGAAQWGSAPITTTPADKDPIMENLRTVVVDGLSVSTADQGAKAIEKLQSVIADRDTKLQDTEKAHSSAIAAKDAEITKKDEEIGKLKADLKKAQGATPKAEDLDRMVADRTALVATVKAIDAKIDPNGKTDADLRKTAVASKMGDEAIKDASDAEISGMFKALARDAKPTDPVADAIRNRPGGTNGNNRVADEDAAYAASIAGLNPVRKEA